MALFGKQKIFYLVNRIKEERELASDDEEVGIKKDHIVGKYDQRDLQVTFAKLEAENAAKLVGTPVDQNWMRYMVKVLPDFDKYLKKLENDPDYQEWTGIKPKPKVVLNPENRVNFAHTKKQNENKYISAGQLIELQNMAVAARENILKNHLTKEQADEVERLKRMSLKVVDDIKNRFSINTTRLGTSLTRDVVALPPNYDAETVRLLREILETTRPTQADSNLVAPTYDRKTRQLVFCNRVIKIPADTDQEEICRALFRSGKPIKKPVQIGDLLVKMGVPMDRIKNNKKVHFAKRELNDRIAKVTLVDNLFHIENKQIWFNEKYV